MTRNYTGRGSEVIALLRFRKHIRNVVTLVTPRIHIHWCKEDSKRTVQHDSMLMPVMRDPDARCEIELIRVAQTFWKPLLPADEHRRNSVVEDEIRVRVTNVDQRAHVLVAQSKLERGVAR